MHNCHRCQKPATWMIMSWFNTDMLCSACSDAEKHHPRYREAREAEMRAVQQGDYNFPGIGYEAV